MRLHLLSDCLPPQRPPAQATFPQQPSAATKISAAELPIPELPLLSFAAVPCPSACGSDLPLFPLRSRNGQQGQGPCIWQSLPLARPGNPCPASSAGSPPGNRCRFWHRSARSHTAPAAHNLWCPEILYRWRRLPSSGGLCRSR